MIQWVGRTPESFTVGAENVAGELLPDPGSDRWRWYWNIPDFAAALDLQRAERDLTWPQVAAQLGSAANEIAHLHRARYGTTIGLAMRAARWLDRTAASFMWEHDGQGLPGSGRRA